MKLPICKMPSEKGNSPTRIWFGLFTLFLVLTAMVSVKAQSPREQDCINAIEICDTFYLQENSYFGPGNIPNEINGTFLCSGGAGDTTVQSGYVETNSVWYRLKVLSNGTLNFTIKPLNATNDYDWVVYNLPPGTPCSQIFFNAGLMVSCNRSATPGNTGANNLPGNQNESVINVTQGQILLINVNNFSGTQSGYIFSLGASTANFIDVIPPLVEDIDVCNNYGFRIKTNELIQCNSVQTNGNDFLLSVAATNAPVTVLGAQAVCGPGEYYTDLIDVFIQPVTTATDIRLQLKNGYTIADKCDNLLEPMDTVFTRLPMIVLGNDLNLCLLGYDYAILDAGVSAVSYLWNTGETTQTILAKDAPATYWVQCNFSPVIPPCQFADTIKINLGIENCADALPNAFTPNDDGTHDTYAPGLNLPFSDQYNIELSILNRWGQTIYTGKKHWDGTTNGSPVENGTYFAVIKYFDPASQENKVYKTPVTLIR